MRHLRNLNDANLDADSILTIGVFDGVHRGHQQLIQRLVARARASGRLAIVLTFYPHPDKVLERVNTRYYLTTPDQRAELLLNLGVDMVITHPFDDETRHQPAAAFIDRLVDQSADQGVVGGRGFRPGLPTRRRYIVSCARKAKRAASR